MKVGKKHEGGLLTGLTQLTDWVTTIAGWLLIILSFIVCFEVLARKFFSYSIQGADELGGYVLAIVSTVGFVGALVHRAHVRIDLVYKYFPNLLKGWLNFLALSALCFVAALLSWRAIAVTWESHAMGARAPTPMATYLALPQGIWAVGLTFLFLSALIGAACCLRSLILCKFKDAADVWGIQAIEEELEDYMPAEADARRSETQKETIQHG